MLLRNNETDSYNYFSGREYFLPDVKTFNKGYVSSRKCGEVENNDFNDKSLPLGDVS